MSQMEPLNWSSFFFANRTLGLISSEEKKRNFNGHLCELQLHLFCLIFMDVKDKIHARTNR